MATLIQLKTGKTDFVKDYTKVQAEHFANAKAKKDKHERKMALRKARGLTAQKYFSEKYEKGLKDETKKMLGGLEMLQKLVVWGTITRLLVPLCSTIIASSIGRNAIDKHEARKEASQHAKLEQEVANEAKPVNLEQTEKSAA